MLETPKAHIPKRKDETSLNVKVAKAEKSYEMIYGANLRIIKKMENQQVSLEQRKPQRLLRKQVGYKRLVPEVVCPSI